MGSQGDRAQLSKADKNASIVCSTIEDMGGLTKEVWVELWEWHQGRSQLEGTKEETGGKKVPMEHTDDSLKKVGSNESS